MKKPGLLGTLIVAGGLTAGSILGSYDADAASLSKTEYGRLQKAGVSASVLSSQVSGGEYPLLEGLESYIIDLDLERGDDTRHVARGMKRWMDRTLGTDVTLGDIQTVIENFNDYHSRIDKVPLGKNQLRVPCMPQYFMNAIAEGYRNTDRLRKEVESIRRDLDNFSRMTQDEIRMLNERLKKLDESYTSNFGGIRREIYELKEKVSGLEAGKYTEAPAPRALPSLPPAIRKEPEKPLPEAGRCRPGKIEFYDTEGWELGDLSRLEDADLIVFRPPYGSRDLSSEEIQGLYFDKNDMYPFRADPSKGSFGEAREGLGKFLKEMRKSRKSFNDIRLVVRKGTVLPKGYSSLEEAMQDESVLGIIAGERVPWNFSLQRIDRLCEYGIIPDIGAIVPNFGTDGGNGGAGAGPGGAGGGSGGGGCGGSSGGGGVM